MSHSGAIRKHKQTDDYDGSGPRPPVPGQESRFSKMTEGAGCSDRDVVASTGAMAASTSLASVATATTSTHNLNDERVKAWKESLGHMLRDQTAVELLKKFIEDVSDSDPKYKHYIDFYLICQGIQTSDYDDEQLRKISKITYKKYKDIIPGVEALARMGDKNAPVNRNVLSGLQSKIYTEIEDKIYYSFFQSRVFCEYSLNYVRGELATAPYDTREEIKASLAAIHEHSELAESHKPKLTADALRNSQSARINVGIR